METSKKPWPLSTVFGIQERITGDSVDSRGNKGVTDIAEQFVQYNSAGVATLSNGQRPLGFQETDYNAFVFRTFDGALVTGVQIGEDGTARMDFDLPDADNDRLRALEAPINDAIAQNLPVRFTYVPMADALAQRGLIRTQAVAPPPTPDGLIRIVEIADLDRQACGGTHLAATGDSPPIRILKIDNKGRHNRRVRIGLVRPPAAP